MSDQPDKVELSSADLAADKRASFEDLFPGVIADGILDVGRLTELLDVEPSVVPDGRERFGLMWAGRNEAVRSLLTPSRGALVPDFDSSVDFDTAENVFVEGDNLEVLKLLQKAYNDRVKLIYIDPPYNTGQDFVYDDDFTDGLRGYLDYTGQLDDEGRRTAASAEVLGRRHSRWLSMIYPRLLLARNLLQEDGVLFVSIDDNEVHHLRSVLDEIFGPDRFVGVFTWRKKYTLSFRDDYQIIVHEYILCYRGRGRPNLRDPRWADESTVSVNPIFKSQNRESIKTLRKGARLQGKGPADFSIAKGLVKLPSQTIEYLDAATFKAGVLTTDVRIRGRFSCGQDRLDNSTVEVSRGGAGYIVEDDDGDKTIRPISQLFDYTKDDQNFVYEQYKYRKSVSTRQATAELESLLGFKAFDNPKPSELIRALVSYVEMVDGEIVLDFFAGSGSTAHGVALQNRSDGVRRRCISVNLPEPTPLDSIAAQHGMGTVADVSRLRLLKVTESIDGARAQGLKAFRLTASNFRGADPEAENLWDVVLSDRTLVSDAPRIDDLAAEILLKEGVGLDVRWERHSVGGDDAIVACGVAVVGSLDITDRVVGDAFALKPRVVVFLEDGFAGNDAVKANAFTNAKNLGITMKTV